MRKTALSDELMIPNFHGVEFEIVDHNGEKWVTVKQVAEALGYFDPQSLFRLIRNNRAEFKGKTSRVKVTRGTQVHSVTVLNKAGCYRVGMLSDAHRDEFDNDCTQMAVSIVREVGAPSQASLP